MHVYRVRHKQTGLFYQAKCNGNHEVTNLGIRGKVYVCKPYFNNFKNIQVTTLQKTKYKLGTDGSKQIETNIWDWEILEYTLDKGKIV